MNKSIAEVRQTFLDFFKKKGHKIIASSSLVPKNDSTLLFTNAGMNQFKNVFLGLDKRNYSSAATSQRCIRVGGKHNDLEKVGYTTRHHTFFEMLGNFSFGDYFKYDAIRYAWELLTSKKWFNILEERLWVTVYENDDESYEIWKEKIGIAEEHIIRIGSNSEEPYISDNFWQMGDTGPCGPCTEIFYDHGDHIIGNPPGSKKNIGDRYTEIWNIVFMQFNRHTDGTVRPLSRMSVDTGMGLERITAVLQNVNSNYEIDLFRKLIASVAYVVGTNDLNNNSLKVIADHIRSCVFLIAEGIIPSNENRGYVLRRIIRHAVRHGNALGVKKEFLHELVDPLIKVMGVVGEDLKNKRTQIKQILKNEEKQFICTLERGLSLLEEELTKNSNNILDGKTAFRLYDTYGFPIDLTISICRERNIKVDETGFNVAMKEQRYRARCFSNFKTDYNKMIRTNTISEFHGYNNLKLIGNVTELFSNNQATNSIKINQEAIIVLNKTSFYAESGGQVGDQGILEGIDFKFVVNNTKKYGQAIAHIGKLIHGTMRKNDIVQANVNKEHRMSICLNHSATHLMHAALRKVLGIHVIQKGSLIDNKALRFDFSHSKPLKLSEIHTIEDLINTQIRRNLLIETHIMDLKLAKEKGAMMLFDGKYGKYVRVVNIDNFSIELCGGTHTSRTGDIGLFRIISEYGIAAGVRRIEAVTGEIAITSLHEQNNKIHDIALLLNSSINDLDKKVLKNLEYISSFKKELKKLKEQLIIEKSINLFSEAIEIKDTKLVVNKLYDTDIKMLRSIVNYLKSRFSSIVVVLATISKNKVTLITGVSKNLTKNIKAIELINFIIQNTGGKGGGNLEIAQAGGIDTSSKFSMILTNIKTWIDTKL